MSFTLTHAETPVNSEILQAALALRDGDVVAFPTETVYGLGADASNPPAVRRIFELKGRPADHPLIVHVANAEHLTHWARDIGEDAYRLTQAFWPGPLTLILKRGKAPLDVTGGQDTVGLRAPRHPVAQALLHAFGGGIAAPSANRFGRVSPTRADHIRQEFGTTVSRILEGGDCEVGLESTILSLAGDRPILMRPGTITKSALESVLGRAVALNTPDSGIRASGTLDSHYAPATPVELCATGQLERRMAELMTQGSRFALMARHCTAAESLRGYPEALLHVMPDEAVDYGRQLYARLRQIDLAGNDLILVETPPDDEHWAAVHDRLRRASHSG